MCYQVVELYSVCRCLHYRHAVDPCQAYKQHRHTTQEKPVLVGYVCFEHSYWGEGTIYNLKWIFKVLSLLWTSVLFVRDTRKVENIIYQKRFCTIQFRSPKLWDDTDLLNQNIFRFAWFTSKEFVNLLVTLPVLLTIHSRWDIIESPPELICCLLGFWSHCHCCCLIRWMDDFTHPYLFLWEIHRLSRLWLSLRGYCHYSTI